MINKDTGEVYPVQRQCHHPTRFSGFPPCKIGTVQGKEGLCCRERKNRLRQVYRLAGRCNGSAACRPCHGTSWSPLSSMTIKASTGQTVHASINRSRSMSGRGALKAQIFSASNSNMSGATFIQLAVLIHSVRSIRIVNPLIFRSTRSLMTAPPCLRRTAHHHRAKPVQLTRDPVPVSPLRTSWTDPRGDRKPPPPWRLPHRGRL